MQMQKSHRTPCRSSTMRVKQQLHFICVRNVLLVAVLVLGGAGLVTCRPQQDSTLSTEYRDAVAAGTFADAVGVASLEPEPSTTSTPAASVTPTNASVALPLSSPPPTSTSTTLTSNLPIDTSSAPPVTVPAAIIDATANISTEASQQLIAAESKLIDSGEIPPTNEETEAASNVTTTTSVSPPTTTLAAVPAKEDGEKWEFDERGLRKCNAANNTALNRCLRLIIHDLRPRLKTGIPELNIPPVDPLRLQSVTFDHGSGPIKITATFKNVIAMGLGHLNKTEFEVDMKRRTLDYDFEIPQMQIVGEYEISGNLFFFPVGGKGNFAVNLQRITAKGQGKLGIVILHDRKTVQMNKIDIDLDIANVKVHLTNLFNGDPVWGNVINKFLNDNSKDIFDEIKPKIAMQVSELVRSVSNRALALLGADHFTDVRNTKVDVL